MVKGKVCESLVRYKCEVLDWATNKGEHWESNTDKINKEICVGKMTILGDIFACVWLHVKMYFTLNHCSLWKIMCVFFIYICVHLSSICDGIKLLCTCSLTYAYYGELCFLFLSVYTVKITCHI